MNRRVFFAAALASALAPAVPAAESPPLRVIRRYSYATDSWTQVRMYELRKGDVFELEGFGIFRAASDPTKPPGGSWEILTDCEIDPATNTWK